MSVYFGRLEAHLTSPAGVYSLTDSGGVYAPTLAAGDITSDGAFSTFIDDLETWLNANGADTWTVTFAGGEGGTGLVSIGCDYNGWSLSLPSTVWELLGFTGDQLTKNGTRTGTLHCIGAWLPGTPLITERGYNDDGTYSTDMRQTISPLGHVKTVWGNGMTENSLTWRFTPRAKTLTAGETTTNQSFETFWHKCILGEHEAFEPGPKLKLFWNADATTPATTYRSVGLTEFRPGIVSPGWTGLWDISIPRMIKVPA